MDRHASGRHPRRWRYRHAARDRSSPSECAVLHRHAWRPAGLCARHLVRHQRPHSAPMDSTFRLMGGGTSAVRSARRGVDRCRHRLCRDRVAASSNSRHQRRRFGFPLRPGLCGYFLVALGCLVVIVSLPSSTATPGRSYCPQLFFLPNIGIAMAGWRSVHSAWHCRPGADGACRRCRHDLHRDKTALRPLCLRHRWQTRESGGTRRQS